MDFIMRMNLQERSEILTALQERRDRLERESKNANEMWKKVFNAKEEQLQEETVDEKQP